MDRTVRKIIPDRAWLLMLIGLVSVVAVACGSDSEADTSSQTIAQVAAGGQVTESAPSTTDDTGDAGDTGDAVAVSTGNAPAISGETFSHGTFNLDMHAGKPVLVNFWFPSCPPCWAEMPDLQAAYEKYGDDVAFIGVQQLGLDSAASGAAFVEELGLTYPALVDIKSEIQFDYEVFSYPSTIFLNRNHDIARTWTGIINEEQLGEQLDALLAG
ncbi:MAG: TlpA disulfide reductase family protein [Dehalococcoidia bacterium]|nr:TlpA disulfide reductase family protein [Dehalococcoidia bacterium]